MYKEFKKRKSNLDVDNASNVITGIMFIAILLAVLLLVLTIVFGLSIFKGIGGSTDISNNTTTIQNYVIGMVVNFFALMPTIGTILAVVILIAAIVLLVLYVVRMKNTESMGGSSEFQG